MAPTSGILLPTMLLALTAPLGAKCPSNLIEVHGKIECAITPDSRVVVTLIYSSKQKEERARKIPWMSKGIRSKAGWHSADLAPTAFWAIAVEVSRQG